MRSHTPFSDFDPAIAKTIKVCIAVSRGVAGKPAVHGFIVFYSILAIIYALTFMLV